MVRAAASADSPAAVQALETLCRTYWRPVYAYILREGVAPEEAKDLNAVKVRIHRLRERFGELLREEIAQTVSTPAEVDEELRYLIYVLSQPDSGSLSPGA